MALQTLSVLTARDAALLAAPEPEIAQPGLLSLADCAQVEFQTALQLLAERAAFVTAATGVAIAIEEDGVLRYRVATGIHAPDPETLVNKADENVRKCLRESVMVHTSDPDSGFTLLSPIARNEAVIGFIEVVGNYEFSDADNTTIARLASLAGIALEHLRAAAAVDARFWDRLQQPLSPKLWHAPETTISESTNRNLAATHDRGPAEIRLCNGCGFPVSTGRKLCVDCEQKPDTSAVPCEVFSTPSQASWISEHGYTLASLLVSAIAAAVIFWLRR